MMRALVLMRASPGWGPPALADLMPGAHAVVLGDALTCIDARRTGFEIRDTLAVLSSVGVRFAFLLRKPVETSTVIAQLLVTGTGALNIGASRVAYKSETDKTPTVGKGSGGLNPGTGASFPHYKENWGTWHVNNAGRWPTNLVFVHGGGCHSAGSRKIPGHKGYPNGPGGKSYQYSSDKRGSEIRPDAWAGHADADGLETIAVYECEPDCPVAMLDEQSGDRPSGGGNKNTGNRLTFKSKTVIGGLGAGEGEGIGGDTGGASRFFPQFKNDAELLAWLERLLSGPV